MKHLIHNIIGVCRYILFEDRKSLAIILVLLFSIASSINGLVDDMRPTPTAPTVYTIEIHAPTFDIEIKLTVKDGE
jgi:hypothetical protein